MLIRPTTDHNFDCITQEQHAFYSGVLAAAWAPSRLDPRLVQTCGLHDTPWRAADARPVFNPDTGLPHDFITYPFADKLEVYRAGLDQLEAVHPYVAYMVSLHYTTFAGTRNADGLVEPERARRQRLARRLSDLLVDGADDALRWVKFFDIFSLYLCLTGPLSAPDSVPHWLRNPDDWSTAPDGTTLEIRWADDARVCIEPWPFSQDQLRIDLYCRRLAGPAENARQMHRQWRQSIGERRPILVQ